MGADQRTRYDVRIGLHGMSPHKPHSPGTPYKLEETVQRTGATFVGPVGGLLSAEASLQDGAAPDAPDR